MVRVYCKMKATLQHCGMRSYRIKSISFVHACYCNNVDVHRVRQFLTGIVALDCDGVHLAHRRLSEL